MEPVSQKIVATRHLTLEEPAGSRIITINIYEPQSVSHDWSADFEIIGLPNEGDNYRHRGVQVDSIGALLQAFEMAAAKLMGSSAYREKRLYWFEPYDQCGLLLRIMA